MFMQNLKILKPDYMKLKGYLKSVDNQELEFEYLVKNIKKKNYCQL